MTVHSWNLMKGQAYDVLFTDGELPVCAPGIWVEELTAVLNGCGATFWVNTQYSIPRKRIATRQRNENIDVFGTKDFMFSLNICINSFKSCDKLCHSCLLYVRRGFVLECAHAYITTNISHPIWFVLGWLMKCVGVPVVDTSKVCCYGEESMYELFHCIDCFITQRIAKNNNKHSINQSINHCCVVCCGCLLVASCNKHPKQCGTYSDENLLVTKKR